MTLDEVPRSATRRRRWRTALQVACGPALAGVAALVVIRLLGLDAGTPLAVPIAVLPYITVGTVALLLLTVVSKSWRLVAPAAVLTVVQVVWMVPRAVPDGTHVPAGASRLRVATCNTHVGGVDPKALVALVRSARLDVLAVEELTPAGVRALDTAGLRELMPYRELHPEIDSSIYSRLPLSHAGLLDRPTTWPQVTAEITVGGRTVRLVAVHTYYPAGNARWWTRDMRELRATARSAGKNLVMLGDFNATLDHAPMRALVGAGLVDTQAELGHGFAPTWPVHDTLPPLVQIDHVLHGGGLAAVSASEHTLPGTDHRALVADLALLD